jgi:glycosyltransferase involved in cell wall biosynthesis
MQVEYKAENTRPGALLQLQDLRIDPKEALAFPYQEVKEIKLSAVIISYNEEAIIGETLSRLWWCDEIIVIDSGSTDHTVQICEEHGCKVFFRAFKGFGEQKNYGVSKAKNDWVLCIDADEVLTEPLIDEIRNELSCHHEHYAAFSIPRNLVFMNRTFNYGKETNSCVTRLFNRTKGSWDNSVVHESVIVDGTTKKLQHKILHYSYSGYSQFINKINLYSSLGAKKLLHKKSTKSRTLVVLSIPFNFFKYYIIDRNFLNGYRGFAWSVLNTCYHFIKYLKLEELRNKE